jgi:N-acetylglucosamine PTS system EIICBA or EIICB component
MKRHFAGLQQLGRAMMLPIAVLPIAGLLLRVGQPDLLGWPAMFAAGDAIFSNLGLLFAVGVGVGLARENHGAGGLAALVGYLVTTHALESLAGAPAGALAKLSIPIGLLSGIIAGYSYNHFGEITLPNYLSFFSGRRFVPIVSGLAGLGLAAVLGYAWPPIEHGMDTMSHAILGAGYFGMFAYGLLNRLLIITGLHHILNNVAWFIIGDYHGATGDLHRFFAGDPTAGAFMSGFFPVMMFGLPGACLAMYHTARPERRARVGGLLLSLALTSFLTGVTEPIEFTFMFLAPVLYALHAVATGLAMVIMNFFGVRLGFSFSAGLFDYVLNYSHAQKPLLLLPIGAAYFCLYYVVFRVTIVWLNLATPGREPPGTVTEQSLQAPHGPRAPAFVTALGGAQNLTEVEACTTRLRLILVDNKAVDEAALKHLGAQGVIRTATNGLQVVLGPIADQVAGEIRAALRAAPAAAAAAAAVATHLPAVDAPGLLAALGGRDNVVDLATFSGRLLIRAARPEKIDESALSKLGLRGIARSAADQIQVLVAGPVENWSEPLRQLL